MKNRIEKKVQKLTKNFDLNEYGRNLIKASDNYSNAVIKGFSSKRESKLPDIEEASKLRYQNIIY